MKIEAVDVCLIKSPLKNPWTTAYGSDADIYSILACVCSGGDVGWSEASPLFAPTYSPESAAGVYGTVKDFLAPAVIGREFESADEINAAMSIYKGNPFAKSVIEIAWWTLESKIKKIPLHELLGGKYKEIEVGADFGVQASVDILLEKIDGAVKAGYPRIKLKAKPGWDLDMLRAVRAAFPKHTFHIDCNSGYTLESLPLFKEIDKLGLAMIEQPLFHADIIDHAKLQSQLETPICLDESVTSPFVARQAIEIGACRYMNLKTGRLGGLSNILKVNDMCRSAGIGCWIGGMLETAVGAGICIEASAIGNMTYPSDIFPSDAFYIQELSKARVELAGPGYMLPSKTTGNAFVPDPDILRERTILSAHFEI